MCFCRVTVCGLHTGPEGALSLWQRLTPGKTPGLTAWLSPLQATAVVIDNINVRWLPASSWVAASGGLLPLPPPPPPLPSACAAQMLDFDDLTQLGDL